MSEPYLHLDDSFMNGGTLNHPKHLYLKSSKLFNKDKHTKKFNKDEHKQIIRLLKAEYQRAQNARGLRRPTLCPA